MKTSYPTLLSTILLLFFCYTAKAQISTFPYEQDFENFSELQSDPSCDLGDDPVQEDGWFQDSTDAADWRPDTAGTPSPGTGPGSTDTTSGVSVGTDVNPGTRNGIYLYIETSVTSGGATCAGTEAGLISPSFDFSASGKYYQMGLYYNMHGLDMGSLIIDIIEDDTVVHENYAMISGDQGEGWNELVVNLGGFNGDNIRIRIRGTMGLPFRGDIAIDQFEIREYTPPTYDALVQHLIIPEIDYEYPIQPYKHVDSLSITAVIRNEGTGAVTQTVVKASQGAYSDSVYVGNLSSFETQNIQLKKYKLPSGGQLDFMVSVGIDENDSFPQNDTLSVPIEFSDSVLAREDGTTVTGGVGNNNGTLTMGQKFYIPQDDTLTSFTFFTTNPSTQDSVRVHLFSFSTTNGPGTLITSSDPIKYDPNQNWYTGRFECEQFLSTGYYFLAIEQLVSMSNMAIGYTDKFFTPSSGFFFDGTQWRTFEFGGFSVSVMLRMNFGDPVEPNVSITAVDTVCEGTQVFLYGNGASTYQWSPANQVLAPTDPQTPATINSTQTFTVTGTNSCGISSTASKTIYSKASPHGVVDPTQLHCKGDTLSLSASGGSSYNWIGGPTNMSYVVSPKNDTTYFVRFDSTNGCFIFKSVNVNVSSIDLMAFGDTTLCEDGKVSLNASGASSYQWRGGPSDSSYTFIASQSGRYVVDGLNDDNCPDSAEVYVSVLDKPDLMVTNDTGACFRDSLYLMASGADQYQWRNGPASSVYPLRVLTNSWYFVTGTNNNGCERTDSVYVQRHLIPSANVSNDTTICEGKSAMLSASGSTNFEWRHGPTSSSVSVSPVMDTRYYVKVLNDFGCFSEDSILVEVDPLPLVGFSWTLDKDSILKITNTSMYADSYRWGFGDGDSSNDENPTHIYTEDGNFNVTLSARNGCGTSDSSIFVMVTLPKDNISNLQWINYISLYPNPTHDEFTLLLVSTQMGTMDVEIQDVNGKLVFNQSELKNQETVELNLNTADLDPGVYWVRLTLNGSSVSRKLVVY